jgi:hypothetical protein
MKPVDSENNNSWPMGLLVTRVGDKQVAIDIETDPQYISNLILDAAHEKGIGLRTPVEMEARWDDAGRCRAYLKQDPEFHFSVPEMDKHGVPGMVVHGTVQSPAGRWMHEFFPKDHRLGPTEAMRKALEDQIKRGGQIFLIDTEYQSAATDTDRLPRK